MRVAVVSQYFAPEAADITNTLASELQKRGHSVRVVTAFPNYPQGKLFSGYKQKVFHRETIDGVRVQRVPIVISHSANALGRVANYLSFGFSCLLASSFVKKADVVYVYATQMTAAISPLLWNVTRSTPYVLHIQDLWPESVTGSGMIRGKRLGSALARIMTPWLRATYERAAAVVAISPVMARDLSQRGASSSALKVIYNWANAVPKRDVVSQRSPGVETITVTYAGSIGHMQDLGTVIRAAHAARDVAHLRLLIVGMGAAESEVRALAEQLGCQNIEFRGRIDPIKMETVYAETDFVLIPLKDLSIFHGTIPSKFQAAISRGIPVISSVPGHLAELVEMNQLGFVAEPESVLDMEQALRRAAKTSVEERSSMGRRAGAFYEQNMAIEKGLTALEQILQTAAARSGRNARHHDL